MTRHIAKNLAEVGTTAFDLAAGRYPSFVYGAGMRPGQVPVFCFHSAEPDLFERRLAFLAENGYVTLTADEYLAVVREDAVPPPKAVVLTFDDGWGSLWSIGFPILRKYGLKIVVFLIPGRIENRGEYLPNLADLQEGVEGEAPSEPGQMARTEPRPPRYLPEDVYGRDSSEHPLLTWEEIAEMHESGLVDFQSHSYSHTLVCRTPRVVDFAHPAMLRLCNLLELPTSPYPLLSREGRNGTPLLSREGCNGTPLLSKEGAGGGLRPSIRLGEPLYESAPRLSDERRVFPPEAISDECASVAEQHGPEFFDRPDWRSELWAVVQKHVLTSDNLFAETEAEHSAAIWLELLNSKRLIEEHLPGKEVRHICYPWHVAGRTALRTAAEVGYQVGFMGKVDGRYYARRPGELLRTARIGGDYFFRLPGKGRAALLGTILGKFVRRVRRGSPYLTH